MRLVVGHRDSKVDRRMTRDKQSQLVAVVVENGQLIPQQNQFRFLVVTTVHSRMCRKWQIQTPPVRETGVLGMVW